MRAPAPVALGCISLVLCLLEPPCLPLPAGRSPKRRDPPDRSPPRDSLPGAHAGPQPPPALPPPAARPRHRPLGPRLGPKLASRHGARLAPRHRLPAPHHGARWGPGPRPPRGRRHAQLLRVGCVLGTCQVQNLSHRLWQLMGQSGRQDSSPMNPNSPHSYG
ncbi:protein ADM2 [Athene noctua]|uniref:protein ADM2 n=1 Tax=Athene noctua TaxID=126797 RepID=UPI003EBEF5F8